MTARTLLLAHTRPATRLGASPDDTDAVRGLFAAVVAADPDYAPVVTSGTTTLDDWFTRKPLDAAVLAFDGEQLVGHVGIRHNHALPGGAHTPLTRPMEMCRLAVRPDVQRSGIASVLVRAVHRRFGDTLWATCHAGYGSHRLLTGLGWTEHAAVTWSDDPRPGTCLFAPTVLTFTPATTPGGGQ